MRRSAAPVLVFLSMFVVAVGFSGCAGCGPAPGDDAGEREDAGHGDHDAGDDAGLDAGGDAGLDAGDDAGLDAEDDAGLDAGDDAGAGEDGGAQPGSARVVVRAVDGDPIEDALLQLGADERRSGLDGAQLYSDLAPGRAVVRITKEGYAPSTAVLDVQAGVHIERDVRLLPIGGSAQFHAADGVNAIVDDVWVVVPPNAVVDAAGAPVMGPVTLTVAGLDPAGPELVAAPGPFAGTDESGAPALLDSGFMADVSLWVGDQPAQIAPGQQVTLGFPISSALFDRFPVGASVPAWWFDLEAGEWREEGAGTIGGDAETRYFVTDVSHLTWWNADRLQRPTCLHVTLTDSVTGAPIAGATIEAVGISYAGTTGGYSDASGQACIDVVANATVRIEATHVAYDDLDPIVVTAGDQTPLCRDAPGGCVEVAGAMAPASGCVSGTVLENSAPVAGATVIGESGQSQVSTTTAADGSYCLRVGKGKQVTLQARRSINGATQRSTTATLVTGTEDGACGDTTCTSAPSLVFQRACASGVVLDDTGAPVAGAEVRGRVIPAFGPGELIEATTGSDGAYCLDVPSGEVLEVFAFDPLFGLAFASEPTAVLVPNTEERCGEGTCTSVSDIVVTGRSCVTGYAFDALGEPAVGAAVTVTVGRGFLDVTLTSVVGTDGSYCVEVPRGRAFQLVGVQDQNGLPNVAESVPVDPIAEGAQCGDALCTSAPNVTFTATTCVEGLVVDNQGTPVVGASVQGTFLLGSQTHSASAVTSDDGSYCLGTGLDSLVGIEVSRATGDFTSSARVSTRSSSAIALTCGAGACATAPTASLPKVTCVEGVAAPRPGDPPGSVFVEATYATSEGWQSQRVATDVDGNYCLTLPQGADVRLQLDGYSNGAGTYVKDQVAITTPVGDEAVCGSGACVAAPQMTAAASDCIAGVVQDSAGQPVANADVVAYTQYVYGPLASREVTNASGEFCVSLPAGHDVVVGAAVGPASARENAWVSTSTTASEGNCGAPASCVQLGTLVPAPAQQGCLSVRAVVDRNAIPAPEGTPIYVYSVAPPTISCAPGEDQPSQWGNLVGEGAVGPGGSGCVQVPVSDNADFNYYYLNVGGCELVHGDPQYLETSQVRPPLLEGTCGSLACVEAAVTVRTIPGE